MNELEKESLMNTHDVNAKVKQVRRAKYLLYLLLAVTMGLLLILFS